MYKVKLIQNNRSGSRLKPIGIVVHETATPGATAEREYQYFNSADRGASAHAFVDGEDVIQTIPYDEVAWHAGPTANSRYIGIELCRPSGHDPEKFGRVWNNAVSLFADLFREHGFGEVKVLRSKISPGRVCASKSREVTVDNLLSHAEVSSRWRESDHTDPVGYFAEYGKTVNEFRDAVQNELNGGAEVAAINDLVTRMDELEQRINRLENPMIYNYIDQNMPEWARETVQKLVDKGYLKGNDQGELGLTDEMLKLFVINDRAGLYH